MVEACALLPAYFYWLVTGDALAAKQVLKIGPFCFLSFVIGLRGRRVLLHACLRQYFGQAYAT